MDIKFYDELAYPAEFPDDLLSEFLELGYAVEQKIDGQTYIKMTRAYYEDLGEYIIKHPRELCLDYWNRLVDKTRNCSIMEFMAEVCKTHTTIKRLTDKQVDFIEIIGEEIERV
jgi:hypothetical protein